MNEPVAFGVRCDPVTGTRRRSRRQGRRRTTSSMSRRWSTSGGTGWVPDTDRRAVRPAPGCQRDLRHRLPCELRWSGRSRTWALRSR